MYGSKRLNGLILLSRVQVSRVKNMWFYLFNHNVEKFKECDNGKLLTFLIRIDFSRRNKFIKLTNLKTKHK